ncbi:MAG TPA: type II secretion system protein GspD [Candidatus Hydrogenedentes bacterium]|nr:type II secretion system protein GspD [Candidatus Hydrogenedentota bacterium]
MLITRVRFFNGAIIVASLMWVLIAQAQQVDEYEDYSQYPEEEYPQPAAPAEEFETPYIPPTQSQQHQYQNYPEYYEPDDSDADAYYQEPPSPIITPRTSRPIEPGTRPTRPPAPPARPTRAVPTVRAPQQAPDSLKTVGGHPMASEEKTGATPTDPVSFDFQDAPLYDVVESISRLTGRNFDVDPNISATTVTIITHDKIPPEMAYEVLESILSTRGYAMVESLEGHLIKIIPTQDATTSEKVPLVMDKEQAISGFDGFSTHILTVQHGDAAEIQRVLQILGSKNGQIDVYAPTNTLIITDTADGLRRMFAFLEQADVPGFDTTMEIFTLEYTRAEVLSNQISQVLMVDSTTSGMPPGMPRPQAPPTPVRPVRATRPMPTPRPGAEVIGSREEVLRMVPDERLNALIVVATEGMMTQVRDLVKRLDTPTPYEANNMHIYQLLNAEAEAIETAIQPLIGTAPRRQATAGAPGGGGGAVAGGGAAPEVQPFEQKVQITRYDRTNSLLIVASPQDYKLLEAFIARLDVPQRQVCVNAVVMDVTMSNDYGLTVDAASISGYDGFGMTNTSTISELVQTAQTAGEIVGGPRAALRNAVLGLGTEGGMTMGVYDDLDFTWQGRKIKVPFVPTLFQAIEKITDVEVLSQPSLVTMDNEEASIVVGQEVPFITSTSSSRRSDGTAEQGYYGGYTRVERHEVGVKLKVTPQISEGDNVMITVELEISDTDATQIGTVDIVGPTTNKSLVNNKSLVKDGATAVIAGLIRDNAIRDNTQSPVLGDIPVLGWLFKSRSIRREKRNMVVLVTPHIIKEGMDVDRLTHNKINEYYDVNVQEIFESGFFDKVFKKHDLRKNYRPTLQRSEAYSGRRASPNFRRGDIER